MSCRVTINYAFSLDRTTISVNEDFKALPAIHQADALRDALHDLTLLYDETVNRIGKDQI